jgi:hypothetical protein
VSLSSAPRPLRPPAGRGARQPIADEGVRATHYARIERDPAAERWIVTGTHGNRAVFDPLLVRPKGTLRWLFTSLTHPHGNSPMRSFMPSENLMEA